MSQIEPEQTDVSNESGIFVTPPIGEVFNEQLSVEQPKPKLGWLICQILSDCFCLSGGFLAKVGPKVCTVCGKSYKSNYKLSEHMTKHTGERPYKCKSCDKGFRSKVGLAQHEAKHTGI